MWLLAFAAWRASPSDPWRVAKETPPPDPLIAQYTYNETIYEADYTKLMRRIDPEDSY